MWVKPVIGISFVSEPGAGLKHVVSGSNFDIVADDRPPRITSRCVYRKSAKVSQDLGVYGAQVGVELRSVTNATPSENNNGVLLEEPGFLQLLADVFCVVLVDLISLLGSAVIQPI